MAVYEKGTTIYQEVIGEVIVWMNEHEYQREAALSYKTGSSAG